MEILGGAYWAEQTGGRGRTRPPPLSTTGPKLDSEDLDGFESLGGVWEEQRSEVTTQDMNGWENGTLEDGWRWRV